MRRHRPLGGREVAELLARQRWNRHAAAYLFDRNPQHIIDGWLEVRTMPGVRAMARRIMDRSLAAALRESAKRAGVRPKASTLRDLDVYGHFRALRAMYDRVAEREEEMHAQGLIAAKSPRVETEEVYEIVARGFRLGVGNVKRIVSEVGRALKDPNSDLAPRAFRR